MWTPVHNWCYSQQKYYEKKVLARRFQKNIYLVGGKKRGYNFDIIINIIVTEYLEICHMQVILKKLYSGIIPGSIFKKRWIDSSLIHAVKPELWVYSILIKRAYINSVGIRIPISDTQPTILHKECFALWKCSWEIVQNLPYLWNTKTQSIFSPFFI